MTVLDRTSHPAPAPAAVASSAAGPDATAVPRRLVQLPTAQVDAPRRRRPSVPRNLERFLGVVLLFAVWEVASQVGWLDPKMLAAPSTVFDVGWDLLRSGTLGDALWASLQRVLWGLAIGVPVGVLLALASGLTRVGDDLVDRNVQMLRFVPVIALQPILILWLGIGETAKISLIVIGVAFPVYVNTSSAIRQIDPGYLELARVVRLGKVQTLRRVVLPGALPGFLVGLRLATAVAWLLLVFAEQMNARSGLGFLMIQAQQFFQSDVIVLCLVVYAVLGILFDTIIRGLEKAVLTWQPGR